MDSLLLLIVFGIVSNSFTQSSEHLYNISFIQLLLILFGTYCLTFLQYYIIIYYKTIH